MAATRRDLAKDFADWDGVFQTCIAAALQGGGSGSRQWQLEWVRDTPCLHSLLSPFVSFGPFVPSLSNVKD